MFALEDYKPPQRTANLLLWRGLRVPVILGALLLGAIAPGRAPYPWASQTGGVGTVADAGDRAVQLHILGLTSTQAGSGTEVLEWGRTLSFPGVAQDEMLSWTVVTGLLCSSWIGHQTSPSSISRYFVSSEGVLVHERLESGAWDGQVVWSCICSAVVVSPDVVLRRELSLKANLLIYHSIAILTPHIFSWVVGSD